MRTGLTAGWYILTYHDVSWEESSLIRGIGGTCPPDVFRDHVRTCATMGMMVSVQEGNDRLRRNAVPHPMFSFWFDDGLAGVRRQAAPILSEYGVSGAMSVCSRFTSRTEMFWRFKLSYIHGAGADIELREKLRALGVTDSYLVRHFVLDTFCDDVLAAIDQVYALVADPFMQEEAFRVFDTPEGLSELYRAGWILANHSAAHYPIGESGVEVSVLDQFLECEHFLVDLTGEESTFWVLPFDRRVELSALEPARAPGKRSIVLMRDKVNRSAGGQAPDLLYRIHSPSNDRDGLAMVLQEASRASDLNGR